MAEDAKRIFEVKKMARHFSVSVASLVIAGGSGVASAEGWFWQPTASTFLEQNDNVRLVTTDEEDLASFGLALQGSLHRETQDLKVFLKPGIKTQRYSSGTDLDSTDLSVDGGITQVYERMQLGLTGRYVDNTTLTSEYEDSGNLRSRIDRQSVSLSPSIQYRITPLTSLKAGVGYSKVSYEEGNTIGYNDYEQTRLDLSANHVLTRRTSLSVSGYQTNFKAEDINNEATTTGALLGVDYKLHENTSLTARVGGYSTDTDYTVGGNPTSDTLTGSLYSLGYTHQAKVTSFTGSLGRKVQPSSTGEVRQEDKVVVGFSGRLTQRVEAGLDATFIRNDYLNNSGNDDRDYRSIGAGLSWHLDPLWTLKATYRNAYQKYDVSNDSATSNRFNISVNYNGLKKTIW